MKLGCNFQKLICLIFILPKKSELVRDIMKQKILIVYLYDLCKELFQILRHENGDISWIKFPRRRYKKFKNQFYFNIKKFSLLEQKFHGLSFYSKHAHCFTRLKFN